MMPPPMSRGMRMVEKRKALVRTRSRYSRFAMSQILRIDFASDLFDKYLFQRGLHHLEAADAGFGDGRGEQRLTVIAVAELDLGASVVRLHVFYGGMIEERRVSFKGHLHAVIRVA